MNARVDNFGEDEFVFPDELDDQPKAEVAEDSVEVEFADGGEVEDKAETTDEDLEGYGQKVQKRIKKLTSGYKEAQRERDEAVRIAQIQQERIKALQTQLTEGSAVLTSSLKGEADVQLAAAKKAYKEAYEAGDADALVEAQEAITSAKIRLKEIELAAKSGQDFETDVEIPQQRVSQPQPDRKAAEWQRKNKWFLTDPELTQYALGYHEKLVQNGYDPTSDEYYEAIDARMRKVFPEEFEDTPVKKRTAPPNVVGSATRSTSPRRVVLNKHQLSIARKLGITPQQYAEELVKQEKQNG
jgi:hypothetical protein